MVRKGVMAEIGPKEALMEALEAACAALSNEIFNVLGLVDIGGETSTARSVTPTL